MTRLTRQEQFAIWVILLLVVGGAFGRAWIRHRAPASPPVAASAPPAAAEARP